MATEDMSLLRAGDRGCWVHQHEQGPPWPNSYTFQQWCPQCSPQNYKESRREIVTIFKVVVSSLITLSQEEQVPRGKSSWKWDVFSNSET